MKVLTLLFYTAILFAQEPKENLNPTNCDICGSNLLENELYLYCSIGHGSIPKQSNQSSIPTQSNQKLLEKADANITANLCIATGGLLLASTYQDIPLDTSPELMQDKIDFIRLRGIVGGLLIALGALLL
jgi:hypothetical protein